MEYTFAGLPLPLRITPPHPLSDEDLMRFSRVPKMYPTEREANGAPLPTGWPTGNKMKMWTTNGAELAWLIEPQERTVTSWCPGCAPERLDALLQVTGEGPVAGFVLPLDRTFR